MGAKFTIRRTDFCSIKGATNALYTYLPDKLFLEVIFLLIIPQATFAIMVGLSQYFLIQSDN
jgi:hypothetical protein